MHLQIQGQAFSTEKDAVTIVKSIIKTKCEEEPTIQDAHCKNILGNDDSTKVCYVSTNVGYFFVMKDMLDSVNVIFNRWD